MSAPQILVLAKAPLPGRVKTRLCPPCTAEQAARIAAAALADTLATVTASTAGHRVLVIDGDHPGAHPASTRPRSRTARAVPSTLPLTFERVPAARGR